MSPPDYIAPLIGAGQLTLLLGLVYRAGQLLAAIRALGREMSDIKARVVTLERKVA